MPLNAIKCFERKVHMETLDDFIPVNGYENKYLISNDGRVYSIKMKRLMHPSKNEKGYLSVEFLKDHKRKRIKLHRLVAEHFIPNPDNRKEINHIDGNKENNCVENLEWSTRSENLKHAYAMGLKVQKKGRRKKEGD